MTRRCGGAVSDGSSSDVTVAVTTARRRAQNTAEGKYYNEKNGIIGSGG